MSERPCPACGAAASRAGGTSGAFEIRSCAECKTLFTGRLPAPGEEKPYDAYYDAHNLTVPTFVHDRLGEVVGSLERYRSLNTWLDVGCGAGTLLRAALGRGWQAIGTEVSVGAVEAGRADGLDVRLGELRDIALPEQGFDVVSVVEVLEHVADPAGVISDSARALRPGGGLYVTTPHGRGISARLLRSGWSAVAPPEHLQLFSVKGLISLLESAGLAVHEVQTHGANPYELLAAARRRGGGDAPTVDRVETGYRLNESLSTSRGGSLLKEAVNGVLSASRLGDGIKLVAERPLTSPRV